MSRIDHAAGARDWLAVAAGAPAPYSGAIADALAAQTHATLALVEQQRIANLIALAGMAGDDSKHEVLAEVLGNEAVWTLATTKMIGPDDEFGIVHPDIAEALGIEVADG